MSSHRCTEQSFLADVANHQMTIIRTEGVYRHLHFSDGTFNMQFDLLTWPGHLCYTGDMGTYVFKRLTDMFEFFGCKKEGPLKINLNYWSEKLQASDGPGKRGGAPVEYSPAKFQRKVKEQLVNWWRDYRDIGRDGRRELREAVQELLDTADYGEDFVRNALQEFEMLAGGECFRFEDIFEWDFDEYTYRYVWCCYAMTWGIRQYHAARVPAAEGVR